MLILNIIFIFLFVIICSDLCINCFPKTNLFLIPISYKSREENNIIEVFIDLKIINKSNSKETMVSNLNLDVNFFRGKNNQYLSLIHI